MLARFRAHLTYANVVATLALFLALGGASYAAIRVGSKSIVNPHVAQHATRDVGIGTAMVGDVVISEEVAMHALDAADRVGFDC